MHAVTDALSLAESMRENAKRIVEEHDISNASCGLAATVHGDAKIGLFERKHIVDAITDHRDVMALLTQRTHELFLLLGRNASENGRFVGYLRKLRGIHMR